MIGIKTVGVIGAGLIGCGWASRCLARNIDVIVFDPSPEAVDSLHSHIDNAWYALEKLGFDRSQSGSVKFASDIEELAQSCEYIQESAPENIDLKRSVHKEIDTYAAPDVIIASSSSGLLPSEIQSEARYPERILIGHPFNPVYLLPLVEIVCGQRTSKENANKAAEFYRSIGMHPLMVRKEIDGYISDRLQEAIWRESLHMISDGVATTQDIDDAIVYGPGLRWAIMGVCLTFHLAGGEQGMRHMLEQFGPALELPWTHLPAPPLTETLIDRMVEGTSSQAGNQSIRELERLRDNCLIGILEVLQQYDYSAGRTRFKSDAS